MSEGLNREFEELNMKLENLWKHYAQLFNEYNPHLEESQRNKMDGLLNEIRTIESKRERMNKAVSI